MKNNQFKLLVQAEMARLQTLVDINQSTNYPILSTGYGSKKRSSHVLNRQRIRSRWSFLSFVQAIHLLLL